MGGLDQETLTERSPMQMTLALSVSLVLLVMRSGRVLGFYALGDGDKG